VEHLIAIKLELLMYVYYRRKPRNCFLIIMFTFGVIPKNEFVYSFRQFTF